jgi:hypothetical protein
MIPFFHGSEDREVLFHLDVAVGHGKFPGMLALERLEQLGLDFRAFAARGGAEKGEVEGFLGALGLGKNNG